MNVELAIQCVGDLDQRLQRKRAGLVLLGVCQNEEIS